MPCSDAFGLRPYLPSLSSLALTSRGMASTVVIQSVSHCSSRKHCGTPPLYVPRSRQISWRFQICRQSHDAGVAGHGCPVGGQHSSAGAPRKVDSVQIVPSPSDVDIILASDKRFPAGFQSRQQSRLVRRSGSPDSFGLRKYYSS